MPFRGRLFAAIRSRFPGLASIPEDRLPLAQRPMGNRVGQFFFWMLTGFPSRDVVIHERQFEGPDCPLTVRIYNQKKSGVGDRPLIVYFHGGGWSTGHQGSSDWICSLISSDLDAVVCSIGYRLAPQNPFPAAVEDAKAGVKWASEAAFGLGANPDRLGVIGDSAGANLAAVVCLALRETGPKISHQSLLYPVTDIEKGAKLIEGASEYPLLTKADMTRAVEYYSGGNLEVVDDWRFSPAKAESFEGLPPTSIVVGGHDLLHDQGVAYAKLLMGAGVQVRLHDFTRMPHAFLTYPYVCADARPALGAVIADMWHSLGTHPKVSIDESEFHIY